MPQVASEAHVASHAGAHSSQRNRPSNGRAEAPPAPFAALIDHAAAGNDDATLHADQAGAAGRDGVKQPEAPRRADRAKDDRHDSSHRTEGNRNDRPARHHGKTDKAEPAEQKVEKAATGETTSSGDAEAADSDDTTVSAGDETKDTKDSDSKSDGDVDAVLVDALPVTADVPQPDATKAAQAEVAASPAAPVVAAQVTTDAAAAGPAEAGLAIDGDKPAATPSLLAAGLKVAGEDKTKVDGKADSAKPAETAEAPDDSALHDALKAQHADETRDGKPAEPAAKSADGDAKAAGEQKTHHSNGTEKAADIQPANTASSHAAQAPQDARNQTHVPQIQHAAQPAAAQVATATPVPQVPAVPIEGVAVQIAAQAKAGKHSFEIRLDPPELGRIDVRLDVDRHGHVTSRLVVDRPETLDLLRRDAGGLERALQDAGLKTSDNGLQFSLRDQTMQQQAFHQHSRDTAEVIVKDEVLPPVETISRGYRPLAGSRGGVDIRV